MLPFSGNDRLIFKDFILYSVYCMGFEYSILIGFKVH